ncbi:MAG: hypothetical protein ACHP6H_00195 [Legionellales bacterium]
MYKDNDSKSLVKGIQDGFLNDVKNVWINTKHGAQVVNGLNLNDINVWRNLLIELGTVPENPEEKYGPTITRLSGDERLMTYALDRLESALEYLGHDTAIILLDALETKNATQLQQNVLEEIFIQKDGLINLAMAASLENEWGEIFLQLGTDYKQQIIDRLKELIFNPEKRNPLFGEPQIKVILENLSPEHLFDIVNDKRCNRELLNEIAVIFNANSKNYPQIIEYKLGNAIVRKDEQLKLKEDAEVLGPQPNP